MILLSICILDEFLQRRYPTNGKWIACSNVTIEDIDKENLTNRLEKSKTKDKNDKIVIGTVGSVGSKYKGHHYVIEALKPLIDKGANIEFNLVGGGDTSFLEKVAFENSISNSVKFLGKKTFGSL